MNGYPGMITPAEHIEPVPRRIRAVLDGETVVDSLRALYVWEHPYYPQWYVPRADVRADLLSPDGPVEHGPLGTAQPHRLRVGDIDRAGAASVVVDSPIAELKSTVWFEWGALDAWFEEDEQVYVHPRSPYVRVDALRSTRRVRVELKGTLLADTASPVMVFETGLPTRYYINRSEVDFTHLEPTDTVTSCPYKGTTAGYWSSRIAGRIHRDVAWMYAFPMRELFPIQGMMAFYNEKVDLEVDGHRLEKPAARRPTKTR